MSLALGARVIASAEATPTRMSAFPLREPPRMALSAGSRLGPYVIVAPLGAGGMGEVYKARDPRLGRDVAIKVLRRAYRQILNACTASSKKPELPRRSIIPIFSPSMTSGSTTAHRL